MLLLKYFKLYIYVYDFISALESTVSTLNVNGNLFSEKQLADSPGFDKYMERYTAVRRKMDWILYYLNVLHRGIHPLDFSRQTTNSVHSGLKISKF